MRKLVDERVRPDFWKPRPIMRGRAGWLLVFKVRLQRVQSLFRDFAGNERAHRPRGFDVALIGKPREGQRDRDPRDLELLAKMPAARQALA